MMEQARSGAESMSMSAKRGARLGSKVDQYYIQATAPPADLHSRVLKQGDTFAVFDRYGDVKHTGLDEEGLYHHGTRYLSCYLLTLGQERPLFLSSTVKAENDLLAVDLTNPDVSRDGQVVVPRGILHLARIKFLWQGVCYESLRIKNYGLVSVAATLTLHFEADFADIFEVRGTRRFRRGDFLVEKVEPAAVALPYRGLDGVVRSTRLTFTPAPAELTETQARFELCLPPASEVRYEISVACDAQGAEQSVSHFDAALAAASNGVKQCHQTNCTVATSNTQFNAWINRAVADLHMMCSLTPSGPYPYAGVPWFSTPFGRDGILTALECLWLDPGMARGVLRYLASAQATAVDPARDAEPGKILHEARGGEMAALGEIPFGRYYGSVDATPLYVLLAGAYFDRTGDVEIVRALWPNIDAALVWIDTYGDADHDGFVEYQQKTPRGLLQQGWKDSNDSIFHADGALAQPPIALCEVQGYVYAAKRAAAKLAVALGYTTRAEKLLQEAVALQERFEQAFWCDDLSTYALALDGDKRPCRVRASNAGHSLFTGIASADRARQVAHTLMNPVSFSGWGIRTVADTEARYNPMSYHNGSIWPHDNALIAAGFARYQLKEQILPILTGLFDTSVYMDLNRLPELFCGFGRREGRGPTLYPVACAPQAWAAGAVFLLLQACLGLEVCGRTGQVMFHAPALPACVDEIRIRNLRVGDATLDLLLRGQDSDVGLHVLRREGQVAILVAK